jgi:hypothetical protein
MFVGFNSARGDLRDERVQVVDEDGDVCPTRRFAVLLDEQVAMLRELPDRLGRVRDECGSLPQVESHRPRIRRGAQVGILGLDPLLSRNLADEAQRHGSR